MGGEKEVLRRKRGNRTIGTKKEAAFWTGMSQVLCVGAMTTTECV